MVVSFQFFVFLSPFPFREEILLRHARICMSFIHIHPLEGSEVVIVGAEKFLKLKIFLLTKKKKVGTELIEAKK